MVSKGDLIILGTGSTRVQCDFQSETWGVNGVYSEVEMIANRGRPARLDKLFVTDYLFSPQGHLHFDIDRVNRLRERFGFEVVSLHPLKLGKYEIKTKLYPFGRISKKFQTQFFTSTISFMLAYALDKDCYKKISLYGIDMHGKEEYMMQKGGVEYWLGRTMERGIEIFIAPGGAVMSTPNGLPYGFRPKVDMKLIDPLNLLQLPNRQRK